MPRSEEEILAELQGLLGSDLGGDQNQPQPSSGSPLTPFPSGQPNMVKASASRNGETYQNINLDSDKQIISNQLDIEKKKEEIRLDGVGNEAAGKVALAKESVKNIEDVIGILFPDGTPDSFRRDIAFGSNVPLSKTPLIGNVIPDSVPFGEQGQTVNRKMGSSLSGRQLIQTGVAARAEETAKLVAQFAPNMFSNPKSAYEGLNQLKDFYKTYLGTIDPHGLKGVKPDEENSNVTPSGMKYKVIK